MCVRIFDEIHYLDARVYGTDEEDVGEYDEDTDVDSKHDWGAAKNEIEIPCRDIKIHPYERIYSVFVFLL